MNPDVWTSSDSLRQRSRSSPGRFAQFSCRRCSVSHFGRYRFPVLSEPTRFGPSDCLQFRRQVRDGPLGDFDGPWQAGGHAVGSRPLSDLSTSSWSDLCWRWQDLVQDVALSGADVPEREQANGKGSWCGNTGLSDWSWHGTAKSGLHFRPPHSKSFAIFG